MNVKGLGYIRVPYDLQKISTLRKIKFKMDSSTIASTLTFLLLCIIMFSNTAVAHYRGRPYKAWAFRTPPPTSTKLTCTEEGFFRHPNNCKKFYRCVDFTGEGRRFSIFRFDCPVGTVFDETISVCNYPSSVPSCGGNEIEEEEETGEVKTPSPQKPSIDTTLPTTTTTTQKATTTIAQKSTTAHPVANEITPTINDKVEVPCPVHQTQASTQLTTVKAESSTENLPPNEISSTNKPGDSEVQTTSSTKKPGDADTATQALLSSTNKPQDLEENNKPTDTAQTQDAITTNSNQCTCPTTQPSVSTDQSNGPLSESNDTQTGSPHSTSNTNQPSSSTSSDSNEPSTQSTSNNEITTELNEITQSTSATTEESSQNKNDTNKDPFQFQLRCGNKPDYIRHPRHCNRYYKCSSDGTGIQFDLFSCEDEKIFDNNKKKCLARDEAEPCTDIKDEDDDKVNVLLRQRPHYEYTNSWVIRRPVNRGREGRQ